MSIMQAMYAGSSALTNLSEAMTVIGNNLANANTTAFKGSTASFEDVLIQSLGSSGSGQQNQVGTGVGLAAVYQDMSAGSLMPTSNVTDLAIDGRGFFRVKELAASGIVPSTGSPRDTFYTRDGAFRKNKDELLVNAGGMVLQGWELKADGTRFQGAVANVDFQDFLQTTGTKFQLNTTAVNMAVSLNTNTPVNSTFSQQVRVYNAMGASTELTVDFENISTLAAPNTWSVSVNNEDDTQTTLGSLTFDSTGSLSSSSLFTGATITFPGTLADPNPTTQTIDFDFAGSVQVGMESTGISQSQDGFPPGVLDKLSINQDGQISGHYTNGQSRKLYQIAIYDFKNEGALEQVGSNLFMETIASGPADGQNARVGRRGSIVSSSLEQSNVDMSAEFVRMISTQRGFQANSRIVSVSDGMLEELISLKR